MNPSHGLSWEKSGEQEGVFATLFILTGKLSTAHTILYSNYFAANVTNNITLNDDFKNYKTLFFVCNNGTAALYCPTIYPASYIKKLYESTKNTQYLGTYPSINTFIGSAQSGAFIPIADNKFKLTNEFLPVKANTEWFIRGGATVALKMFG